MHVSDSAVPSDARAAAPLDVEIDDALIAPGSWQAVDLDGLAPCIAGDGQGGPLVVTARFAPQPMVAGNDNPAMAPPASAMFLSGGGVANDDFLPEVTGEGKPAPMPRRLRRVVRVEAAMDAEHDIVAPARPQAPYADVAAARAAADGASILSGQQAAPMRVMPMPVAQPLDWQGMRRMQSQRQGLDRASLNSLVIIMIGAWLAVVAFGVYKFSTPSNGAKILWER